MAELKDIKAIKPDWLPVLAGGRWTVSKLATADIKQLTTYPGIGDVTAQRIIGEARQLVNIEGLNRSKESYSPPAAPAEPLRYSVRVQRIMERQARGE